jgi:chemotaxis regulatin CheY-phosphate phosphatase CheZ
MKKNIRGFYWKKKAWYAHVTSEKEIIFGMYGEKGGSPGEIVMKWHNLMEREVPRLECFEDSWETLYSFSDLLKVLANHDSENISQEKFVEILLSCDFKDLTPYEKKV